MASLLLGSASAGDPQIVLLGLRPVKQDRSGELGRLPEAQALRAIAQGVLQQVSGQAVIGHDVLAKQVGPKYLVTWFNCAGDLSCMAHLLAPLRDPNVMTAITGDYTIVDAVYKFRFTAFTIADGKVAKEVTFDIAEADLKDPAKWRDPLVRIIASARLRIISNVTDATCEIDGQPCVLESDRQTLAVTPGEHTIVLSKAGHESAKVVVVVTGTEKEVAVALKPLPRDQRKPGEPKPKPGDKLGGTGPTLTAVRVDQRPTLDGKLDDAVWQKAWLETNFTQHFPDEGKAPTQRTELRVLYDDDAVYIGIRCEDSEPGKIVARLTRRDRENNTDRVAIDISSRNDKASAYHFEVNAAGVQLDGVRFNDTEINNDWDGRWYVATTIDDKGWTAEFKIPLVTLRYSGDVSSFGFQARRYLGRRGEIAEWAYVPSTAKSEVSNYGTIENIDGLKAKRLLEILVYDLRSFVFRKRQGVFDGREDANSLGADFKLGLTSALTANGTINPDFGTVEVDQVILNLTTVETYFPEKRPFFIEGADLFETPFKLFYSRRIGATPPFPGAGTPVEPLPNGRILGAVKITGVLTGRLSIGVLDAITARRDAVIERTPGGTTERVLVEPLSNFGVLRLRQDFGTNSSIGLIATTVNRLEPADSAAPQPGDVCPVPYSTTFTSLVAPPPRDGRCTNDAYAGGVDTTLRTSDGEWGAKAQVVGTRIENGPTRLIPDGTSIGSGSSGFGSTLEVGRYGGENWLFRANYFGYSPRFQINDAGFLEAANTHYVGGAVKWRTTKPTGRFQSVQIEAALDHRRTWNGRFLSLDPLLNVSLQFKNLWTIRTVAEPYYQPQYDNRESQDGALTERNHGFFYTVDLASDPTKPIVIGASTILQNASGGLAKVNGGLTISMRPTPTLEIDILANIRRESNEKRWVETVDNMDGSRTYLFARLDARSADITLRATYTATRKLSIQAYLQPFVASGHYTDPLSTTASGRAPILKLDSFISAAAPDGLPDFRDGAINLNLFMRYEYLPLSALWLVYTRQQVQPSYDAMEGNGRLRLDRFTNGPTTDVILVKLNYLWY